MKSIPIFLFVALASFSFSADDKPEPKAVQVNFGLARDYILNKNSNYFKLVYNDRVLKESGKAPNATALDSSDLIQADDNNGGTSISFRRGVGALSGNLVEAFGIKPFKLPWAKAKDFMISGGANINMEGNRRVEVDLGLQLRPISIMNNSYISNWFTIGAEHSNVTNGGGPNTIDSDMITFRAFAGRAFSDVVDSSAEKVLQEAIRNLTSVASTEELAKKYAESHPDNTDKITYYYGLFKDAGPTQKAKGWFNYASDVLSGQIKSNHTHARGIIYAEAQGQYGLSQKVEYRRYNSLWATGFVYDLSKEVDKSTFLDVRFEHGYLRADPSKGTDCLLITAGLRF